MDGEEGSLDYKNKTKQETIHTEVILARIGVGSRLGPWESRVGVRVSE